MTVYHSKSFHICLSVYSWAGLECVPVADSKLYFLKHRDMVMGGRYQQLWQIIWFPVIWSIWLMWNNIIFKRENFDLIQILDLIKVRSWKWLASRMEGKNVLSPIGVWHLWHVWSHVRRSHLWEWYSEGKNTRVSFLVKMWISWVIHKRGWDFWFLSHFGLVANFIY